MSAAKRYSRASKEKIGESRFFVWVVNQFVQLQFLAPVDFFKAVERLQFLTRVELLLFLIYSFRAVWLVMTALVSRMEHSTIVEGQRLGTVHIIEGTCSRLRFFS